jgi:Right handed beta helix region
MQSAPRISLLLLSLATAFSSLPAHARGLSCGMVLAGPVTLSADLVCQPGEDGLIVGDHNVRIELNGFRITGPYSASNPTSLQAGVRSQGFDYVQIVGPGRIDGFSTAIDIDGGNEHLISGIAAPSESGAVSVRNSSKSVIENSVVSHIEIVADPGRSAVWNRISGNVIGAPAGGPGLSLAGCDANKNTVEGNRFNPNVGEAIVVVNGPSYNRIVGNKVTRGEVKIIRAGNNLVADNTIRNDSTGLNGIVISDAPVVGCAGGGAVSGSSNVVRDNQIYFGGIGVSVWDGGIPGSSPGNLITRNGFKGQSHSALFFDRGTVNNDARGNLYASVPLIADDQGQGNLWP